MTRNWRSKEKKKKEIQKASTKLLSHLVTNFIPTFKFCQKNKQNIMYWERTLLRDEQWEGRRQVRGGSVSEHLPDAEGAKYCQAWIMAPRNVAPCTGRGKDGGGRITCWICWKCWEVLGYGVAWYVSPWNTVGTAGIVRLSVSSADTAFLSSGGRPAVPTVHWFVLL